MDFNTLLNTSPNSLHGKQFRIVSAGHCSSDIEGAWHVPHVDALLLEHYAHDVKAIVLARTAVAVYPCLRGFRELTLFPAVDRLHRGTKCLTGARFHLDKRDQTIALSNHVDVATAGTKPSKKNLPAGLLQPARGDAFSEFAEGVRRLGHASKLGTATHGNVTVLSRL